MGSTRKLIFLVICIVSHVLVFGFFVFGLTVAGLERKHQGIMNAWCFGLNGVLVISMWSLHTTNGNWFTMSYPHKNQLVQSKQFLVKTNQIRWWLTIYQKLYGYQLTISKCEELASPKQTAIGKDISNPLIADSLLKIMFEPWYFKILFQKVRTTQQNFCNSWYG